MKKIKRIIIIFCIFPVFFGCRKSNRENPTRRLPEKGFSSATETAGTPNLIENEKDLEEWLEKQAEENGIDLDMTFDDSGELTGWTMSGEGRSAALNIGEDSGWPSDMPEYVPEFQGGDFFGAVHDNKKISVVFINTDGVSAADLYGQLCKGKNWTTVNEKIEKELYIFEAIRENDKLEVIFSSEMLIIEFTGN